MDNKYPEINVSLVGAKIRILDNNRQHWLKPGTELTVKAITKNNKFQFFESKYAWGCENNQQHKYFEVLSGSAKPTVDLKNLKHTIVSSDLSMEKMLEMLDQLVEAKEHNLQLATV